jgi:hypothetical protein
MAKDKISQYSSTSAGANLNTDIAGINIDEGCAPSNINNAIRTLMAQIRDLQSAASGDTIPIGAGGTGSTTASGARTALSAAASGANSDITSLTGLTTALSVAQGGTGATTLTGLVKGSGTSAFTAATAGTDYAAVGTASTWTASQRGTVTTDNDGSFDMAVTNNFKCTPTATFALTFTNITAGQSGYVLLVNTGGYAVTAAATTKVNTSFLTTVSTAGTYLLSYFTDGTNVYVTTGGAMA